MAESRPTHHPDLGKFFEALRTAKGWNQSEAADFASRRKIKVSYQTIRGLEAGKTKNADPEALRAIARLYDHPYELIAAEVFRARYGVTVSGNDLIWQTVDQKSGRSSNVGDVTNDPASARILQLESENTELRSALAEVTNVASKLVEIAEAGTKGHTASNDESGRRERDRKIG